MQKKTIYIISVLASGLGIMCLFEHRLIPITVGLFLLENLLLVLAGTIRLSIDKSKEVTVDNICEVNEDNYSENAERLKDLREELYEVENALYEKRILLEKEEARLEKQKKNMLYLVPQT